MGKEISSLVEYLKDQKEQIVNLSGDKDEVSTPYKWELHQLHTNRTTGRRIHGHANPTARHRIMHQSAGNFT
jgi:hypothetical protein